MYLALPLTTKLTRSGSTVFSFDANNVFFDLRVSTIVDDTVQKINVHDATQQYQFNADYFLWRQETSLLSVNIFDNYHFNAIVSRGEESVPFIFERLKKGPTHLIHALELIYPEKVTYNQTVISLKRARKVWLKILKKQLG